MKIAYLGYDILFECLLALEGAGCEVMEAFTCPTDNVFEFNHRICEYSHRRGIPCTVNPISLADLHRLSNAGCRAVFCAGYFYKIPVADSPLPMVNVHPALLPEGRGAWPMPVQILRGMDRGGVTLHKIAEQWDAGDILLQKAFPIAPTDDLELVTQKVNRVATELCTRMALHFDEIWGQAVPQGPGTYWPCPQKEDCTITPQTSPAETERILRAFYGFDCYLKDAAREQQIIRGRFYPQPHRMPFGQSFPLENGGTGYWVQGGRVETPPKDGVVL